MHEARDWDLNVLMTLYLVMLATWSEIQYRRRQREVQKPRARRRQENREAKRRRAHIQKASLTGKA